MASIKYFIRSKSDNSQIYIRFSAGINKDFQKKTEFVIDVKD